MNKTLPSLASMAGVKELLLELRPLAPTYAHLIISALFPIYVGSHASLSRPSTAATPPKKDKRRQAEYDEDEEPAVQRMEGMSASDAITFPLLAGVTLTGLYFLIKWLEDPAILNKILNWYFASFSIFSIGRLVSDGLDVVHSLAFPKYYADGKETWEVRPLERRAVRIAPTDAPFQSRNTPLPGPFARLPLPQPAMDLLWFLRTAPNRKFTIRFRLSRLLQGDLSIGIHGLEGLTVGLLTVLYYNLVSKPWYLTNLMGFSFAYGALQLLSPTTFTVGTLLLSGLFIYDIYMVFYTPMMVSVAKNLEIPAKLEFPRPDVDGGRGMAMLGLGDVVLPGVFVGLALRFDLWLHYFRKQKKLGGAPILDPSATAGIVEGYRAGKHGMPHPVEKAHYIRATSRWGEMLWMSRAARMLTGSTQGAERLKVQDWRFAKPYFTATMTGYILGMLVTLVAMQVSNKPQPALLYLVPGVVGAVWGCAVVRGEVGMMVGFTEADEEEKDEQAKDMKKDESKNGEGKTGEEKGDKTENLGRAFASYAASLFGAGKRGTNEKARNATYASKGGKREHEAGDKMNEEESVEKADSKETTKHESKSRPFIKIRLPRVFEFEMRLPPSLPEPESMRAKTE